MRLLGVLVIGIVTACATEPSGEPGSGEADEPETQVEQTLDDDSCGTIGGQYDNRGAWFNHLIPQQYGRFTAKFEASPAAFSATTVDAVIGFSNDEADGFSDLGPIVRFNPSGFIDVRNGSVYTADTRIYYVADWQHPYEITMDIDIPRKRYTVWVRPPVGTPVRIAYDYAFRSEQAGMSRISMLAGKMDSPDSFVNVCYLRVTPPVCANAAAGGGWVNTAFRTMTNRFGASFAAYPSANNIDAVMGLSRTTAARFSDLAAIVRFNPAGTIDARDGSTYRADAVVPYLAGERYDIFFSVDLDTGLYFVAVTRSDGRIDFIANSYRLRTEQTGVTSISSLGQYVDGGSGSVRTCELSVNETPW